MIETRVMHFGKDGCAGEAAHVVIAGPIDEMEALRLSRSPDGIMGSARGDGWTVLGDAYSFRTFNPADPGAVVGLPATTMEIEIRCARRTNRPLAPAR